MVQFGRPGSMHPYTVEYMRHALFEHGEFEMRPAPEYSDEDIDWEDEEQCRQPPVMYPNDGWQWLNAGNVVEGMTWGGDLDILSWQLSVNRYLLPNKAYAGRILCIETDEELPSATAVYRILMCMGERGLLQQFAAMLVARPKAWAFEHQHTLAEKKSFIDKQCEAIQAALHEYHTTMLTVFNLDFGHTDPQVVIPHNGRVRVDGIQRRIYATY